ncbi:MAG: phosphatase PAP2 family protein [Spirochaetaceae bacterium]|nr:phosphatase PAP2 family protein [Spirochaetaceae bacterium]
MSGWEIGWGLEFLVFMNNLGGRALDIALEPLHWIGGEVGYTIILPILFWSVNDRMGRRLYLLAMFSALLNGVLKIWWARPRPYVVDPARITPAHVESSYGIPSGHAQGGMILGLFFAHESRKTWVKGIIYAAVALMGISRMTFGVHFLQDVLVGWILGGLVFGLFVFAEDSIVRRFRSISVRSLFPLALLPGILALGAEALVPAVYPATKSLLATGAALSGILIGMALERSKGAYRSDGITWKRIVRVPIGMILIFGIQRGLSALFYTVVDIDRPSFGLSALYSLRYLTVGFCGYWLIPEIFIRLHMAGPREQSLESAVLPADHR